MRGVEKREGERGQLFNCCYHLPQLPCSKLTNIFISKCMCVSACVCVCVYIAVKSGAVVRFISNWSSKRKAVNGKSHTATKRAQHVAPGSAAAAATRLLLLLLRLCILLLPLACLHSCHTVLCLLCFACTRSPPFCLLRVSRFSF